MKQTPRPTAQDALLDAAAATLAENPSASLSEIARRAGVGRATLHRHFASRDALIAALTREALARIDAVTAPIDAQAESAGEALWLVLDAVVPLGDRYHFLSRQTDATSDPEVAEITARQTAELAALIDAVKAEGGIAPEVPTGWAVVALDSLIYAAWSAVEDGSIAPRDAASLVHRTFLQGLGPPGLGPPDADPP